MVGPRERTWQYWIKRHPIQYLHYGSYIPTSRTYLSHSPASLDTKLASICNRIQVHPLPRLPPLLIALVSSGSLPQVTSIFWIYGKSMIPLEQCYTWCKRKLANLGLAGAVSWLIGSKLKSCGSASSLGSQNSQGQKSKYWEFWKSDQIDLQLSLIKYDISFCRNLVDFEDVENKSMFELWEVGFKLDLGSPNTPLLVLY